MRIFVRNSRTIMLKRFFLTLAAFPSGQVTVTGFGRSVACRFFR